MSWAEKSKAESAYALLPTIGAAGIPARCIPNGVNDTLFDCLSKTTAPSFSKLKIAALIDFCAKDNKVCESAQSYPSNGPAENCREEKGLTLLGGSSKLSKKPPVVGLQSIPRNRSDRIVWSKAQR
jgi:hypothetical protein